MEMGLPEAAVTVLQCTMATVPDDCQIGHASLALHLTPPSNLFQYGTWGFVCHVSLCT